MLQQQYYKKNASFSLNFNGYNDAMIRIYIFTLKCVFVVVVVGVNLVLKSKL